MQCIDENSKDVEMLQRVDSSPLDTGPAEGDEQLVKQVRRHNTAVSDLTDRFETLAADRKQLANADDWFAHDGKAVLAERRRVAAESWDVLVTLRKLIQERKDLLDQLHTHVADKINDLEEQYGQALDTAHKMLAREHREHLKNEPAGGQAYVETLAEEDEAVVALRDQIARSHGALDKLQTLDHRAGQNTALTSRQREVYELLN